jgi:hypothetical protein
MFRRGRRRRRGIVGVGMRMGMRVVMRRKVMTIIIIS